MSEWEIVEEINKEEMKGNASIRVIGVGGGGGNDKEVFEFFDFLMTIRCVHFQMERVSEKPSNLGVVRFNRNLTHAHLIGCRT